MQFYGENNPRYFQCFKSLENNQRKFREHLLKETGLSINTPFLHPALASAHSSLQTRQPAGTLVQHASCQTEHNLADTKTLTPKELSVFDLVSL